MANITSLSATVTPIVTDSDGDGVPDANDKCPGSSSGAVDADGCTIAQLVPCAAPAGGGKWRNHGHHISEAAKTADAFVQAGLITRGGQGRRRRGGRIVHVRQVGRAHRVRVRHSVRPRPRGARHDS